MITGQSGKGNGYNPDRLNNTRTCLIKRSFTRLQCINPGFFEPDPVPPAIVAMRIPPLCLDVCYGREHPTHCIRECPHEGKINKKQQDRKPGRNEIQDVIHACGAPAESFPFIPVSEHSIQSVCRTKYGSTGKPEYGKIKQRGDNAICQIFGYRFIPGQRICTRPRFAVSRETSILTCSRPFCTPSFKAVTTARVCSSSDRQAKQHLSRKGATKRYRYQGENTEKQ